MERTDEAGPSSLATRQNRHGARMVERRNLGKLASLLCLVVSLAKLGERVVCW